MSQILIKNAHVINPETELDEVTDIAINGSKIAGLGKSVSKDFKAKEVIDAKDHWVLPGLVDLSAYLREPGQENKTRIPFETYSAASAGITRICCMPEPLCAIDSGAMVKLIRSKVKKAGYSRVSVIGALSQHLKGEQLSHMGSLKYVGCVGLSQGHAPVKDLSTLRKAMEYAVTFDMPLFLHPIDHSLMITGGMHEGALSTRLGLNPIPVAAETAAMAQILTLVEQTQSPVHFCRLSSSDSMKMLKQAKDSGLPVTADVAAHQLFLTEMDVCDYNPLCHTVPPLRSERDRDALRQAASDGLIDAICSDHQPHEIDAKLAPFEETSPGISAFETLLPLTMRLVEEKVLSKTQAISYLTNKPAKLIRKRSGNIEVGRAADFSIYDPNEFWQLETEKMTSRGKNTPFSGWGFNGKTIKTFVRGKKVYDLNEGL